LITQPFIYPDFCGQSYRKGLRARIAAGNSMVAFQWRKMWKLIWLILGFWSLRGKNYLYIFSSVLIFLGDLSL
jgi:hypothetical protein